MATARSAARPPKPRLSLAEVMVALEAAGTAQTRKTYARHGITGPMFGVLAPTTKALQKRIGVDHALALALWATQNHDARTLAAKVADPSQLSPTQLNGLAGSLNGRSCENLVAQLTVDGPHAIEQAEAWLAHAEPGHRSIGWSVVGGLALADEALPDAWFTAHLRVLEATLHAAPNVQRSAMNHALIAIGCRNPALRALADGVARRLGVVHIDHGNTSCKTPDASAYIQKTWEHAESKGFATPAAQERSRELIRLRC